MKKRKNSQKKLVRTAKDEMEYVSKCINQLTREEMSQFEAVSRIQLAQVLLDAYLSRKSNGSRGKVNRSSKKRSR